MSKRYNLTLRNKKTGRNISSLQLFGNNDWFQSFVPFLEQYGANIDPNEPYIPEENAIIITDLLAFVKAIDETECILQEPLTVELVPLKKLNNNNNNNKIV